MFRKIRFARVTPGNADSCPQPRNIVARRKEGLYAIREVYPRDHERFALRGLPSFRGTKLSTTPNRERSLAINI
jgi:hypothetical protein